MGLTKDKNTISVCFTGVGYEDILTYFLQILRALGYKALVEDCTEGHRFYSCIPHIEGINPNEETLDIVYAFYHISGSDKAGKIGNLVSDIRIELSDLDKIDSPEGATVVVIDEHNYNLEILDESKHLIRNPICMVIRNYTGVRRRLIERLASELDCEMIFSLPVSQKDHLNAILAEDSEKNRLTGISAELKAVLEQIILRILPEVSSKAIKHACRDGFRSKLCNS